MKKKKYIGVFTMKRKTKQYPRFFVYFIGGKNNLVQGGYIKINNKTSHPIYVFQNGEEIPCNERNTRKVIEKWCAGDSGYREVIKEELALII